MKRLIAVGIIILLVGSGCSALKKTWNAFIGKDETGSAQELAWDGMDAYEDGDYKDAIEYFQKLKDWYPFSKYAILAELKIADAHYHLKQYDEAIFAYEEFEKLHPRNEAVPYVIYQIGTRRLPAKRLRHFSDCTNSFPTINMLAAAMSTSLNV